MGGGMMLMLSCRMQGKNLWANRVAHRFMGGKIRPYTPIGWEIRLFSPQNQAILWAEQFAHSHPSAKNLAMGEWAGGIYPAHSPIQIGPAHSDNQSTSKASAKCQPDCHQTAAQTSAKCQNAPEWTSPKLYKQRSNGSGAIQHPSGAHFR